MSRAERRLRRRRQRRGVLVMGGLLALVGIVVFQALQWSAAREQKAVPPGQEVTITVASGQSSVEIGRALRDAGVVDSVNRFRDVAEERGLDGLLKPGTYKLVTGMSIDAVLDILAKGPSTGVSFTIPEGYTVAQIVDKIAATKQFTKAELTKALKSKDLIIPYRPKGVTSLEGLLFPDTYGIEDDDTAESVLQDMLSQLEIVLSRHELSTAPRGLNPYELLIVASMIEREAKVDGDRPKIAAVIYNRLAADKPLEIDATVEYAVGH
ncbi:MAG TPA: endolytic transglycosylase MltG, partial [Actinomycetota bacterium]|nr:endolytic transglycosylase MltG [Actinomycetota bacterium]